MIVLEDGSDRDELRRALRALPERQRAAIVLRFYEDLSERETADVMRCSVRAVNSLVVRAMATLRAQMGGGEP
jgi:RNA polymerase sigma factor (sigma-70 family)